MTIRINVTASRMREIEETLGEMRHQAPIAVNRALNRAITNVASNLSKEVRKYYHVKASSVKETMTTTKSSPGTLAAEVRASGKPLPLDRYKVSPKTVNPKRKGQLKIAVKKDGVKQIMGAFIVNLHGIKVFNRTGEFNYPSKGSYKGKGIKREMVDRLFGLSVPQMMDDAPIVDTVYEEASDTFERRLQHEINNILSRAGGRS